MDPSIRDIHRDKKVLKLSDKLIRRENQLGLLNLVHKNTHLLQSRILSSIKPKIGKTLSDRDLERKGATILMQARSQILEQCAIPEATRNINNIRLQLTKVLSRYDDIDRITKLMDEQQSRIEKEIEKKISKKSRSILNRSENHFHQYLTLRESPIGTEKPTGEKWKGNGTS